MKFLAAIPCCSAVAEMLNTRVHSPSAKLRENAPDLKASFPQSFCSNFWRENQTFPNSITSRHTCNLCTHSIGIYISCFSLSFSCKRSVGQRCRKNFKKPTGSFPIMVKRVHPLTTHRPYSTF